MDPTGDLDALE